LTSAKGIWETPTVEELDFSSTESSPTAPGVDGPYTS
jgi:hypothetical protein